VTTGWTVRGSIKKIPVGAKFSAPVQTGPGAHSATCTMDTGPFPGVKRPGRGADHPPLLAPRLRMSRALPLLPSRPLVACYRVTFTFLPQHDLVDAYKVGVCFLSGRNSVFKSWLLEIPLAYLNRKDERSLSGNVRSRKFSAPSCNKFNETHCSPHLPYTCSSCTDVCVCVYVCHEVWTTEKRIKQLFRNHQQH
jgi:hypothetical protein